MWALVASPTRMDGDGPHHVRSLRHSFRQPALAQWATTAGVMPCQSLRLSMLIERCKQVTLHYEGHRNPVVLLISKERANLL